MDTLIPDAWRELNATARDVLVLLAAGGPATGPEMHKRYGEEAVSYNTISNNLRWLTEDDYAEATGHGRRPTYALTEAGRDLVERAIVGQANQLRLGVVE